MKPTVNTDAILYPSPADELLIIENLTYPLDRFDMFDLLGRSIHTQVVNGSQDDLQIGLSQYPAGVYVIRLTYGDDIGIESRKISIQH